MSSADFELFSQNFRYEPETGKLFRLKFYNKPEEREINKIDDNGYIRLDWRQQMWASHRVAFLLMTGEWPFVIDHINGIRHDNRWTNLRNVDVRGNSSNKDIHRDGKLLGVSVADSGRFESRISVDSRNIWLGTFDTPEQAHNEYNRVLKIIQTEGVEALGLADIKHKEDDMYGISWYSSENAFRVKTYKFCKNGSSVGTFKDLEAAKQWAAEARKIESRADLSNLRKKILTEVGKAGVLGVWRNSKHQSWDAYIPGDKRMFLGRYETIDKASEAVQKAKSFLMSGQTDQINHINFNIPPTRTLPKNITFQQCSQKYRVTVERDGKSRQKEFKTQEEAVAALEEFKQSKDSK